MHTMSGMCMGCGCTASSAPSSLKLLLSIKFVCVLVCLPLWLRLLIISGVTVLKVGVLYVGIHVSRVSFAITSVHSFS